MDGYTKAMGDAHMDKKKKLIKIEPPKIIEGELSEMSRFDIQSHDFWKGVSYKTV